MDPDRDMPFADVSLDPEDEKDGSDGLGLLALVRDTTIRPRSAMTRLAAQPGRRWLFPILALLIAVGASSITGLRATGDYRETAARAAVEAQMQDQIDAGNATQEDVDSAVALVNNPAFTAVGVIFALLAPIVGALIVAAIMHMFGTVLGGQQTFTQMFTVTAWARLPLVYGALVTTVQHLLGGWDPNPRGLSGLVACDPLDGDCTTSFLQPVLAEVELWNLWYLGLLAVAVWAASRVSRRKAVAAVLFLVVLRIAIGASGVAIGQALSGLGG